MALNPTQIKLIKKFLHSGTEGDIARMIEKIHPTDLTILFSELSPSDTKRLLNSLLLVAKAGKTLLELPEFMIPDILESIENDKLTSMLSRMESDDAFFLLEKLPESRWKEIIDLLPENQKSKLEKLLIYPKNSAGSVMTSNYLVVNIDMTIEQAIESLRNKPEIEGIFYIYVIDNEGHLLGVQSLRGLVMSKPGTKIRDIMGQEITSVFADDPASHAAHIVERYNLLAIPVVTRTRELVGVITVDDVIDIVKEEAEEDIYNLAGLSGEDRASTPIVTKITKRLPWMVMNLFTAALAATVVGFFQGSIKNVVVLAVFLPIISNIVGNGAVQSLTVMVRAMATDEFSFIKGYKAVFKETISGAMIGIICGILMGLAGAFWKQNWYLGFVLSTSTILSLILGSFIGSAIPFLFRRFKLDPAVGTSVIITMFTDFISFGLLLEIATIMMKYLEGNGV